MPSKPLVLDAGPDLVFKEATVHGVHGRQMFATWEKMCSVPKSGKLDLSQIVTHQYSLSDYDQAFATTKGDDALKVQIRF